MLASTLVQCVHTPYEISFSFDNYNIIKLTIVIRERPKLRLKISSHFAPTEVHLHAKECCLTLALIHTHSLGATDHVGDTMAYIRWRACFHFGFTSNFAPNPASCAISTGYFLFLFDIRS